MTNVSFVTQTSQPCWQDGGCHLQRQNLAGIVHQSTGLSLWRSVRRAYTVVRAIFVAALHKMEQLYPSSVVMAWMRPASVCNRSEEHTSELQSLMRISYAVFCLKKNN